LIKPDIQILRYDTYIQYIPDVYVLTTERWRSLERDRINNINDA